MLRPLEDIEADCNAGEVTVAEIPPLLARVRELEAREAVYIDVINVSKPMVKGAHVVLESALSDISKGFGSDAADKVKQAIDCANGIGIAMIGIGDQPLPTPPLTQQEADDVQ